MSWNWKLVGGGEFEMPKKSKRRGSGFSRKRKPKGTPRPATKSEKKERKRLQKEKIYKADKERFRDYKRKQRKRGMCRPRDCKKRLSLNTLPVLSRSFSPELLRHAFINIISKQKPRYFVGLSLYNWQLEFRRLRKSSLTPVDGEGGVFLTKVMSKRLPQRPFRFFWWSLSLSTHLSLLQWWKPCRKNWNVWRKLIQST